MALFHLDYPESQVFFKWDELGCLCRALGFPSGLFQTQLESANDEIHVDENGISLKTLQRVWDLKLMFKPLHRTFNMHTADWNTCTFTTALYLLTHRALSFQDLHNTRVAYCAYEHIDMKGMLLDKHTLLRTLKMCGRTIAPLKLMHRIKHMKGSFEEKGRIQLYEFFNLILWCDIYTSYSHGDMETASGKEEELYRIVDFRRLLSHHDERMSKALDATYLQEEWDFGMECLGPNELFKEPVVNTDARVAQVHYHQGKYRHLKQEVGLSQRRVYRAHAGTVRSRPVSAPDLEDYRRSESAFTRGSTTATQVYESVQRRLHSAPSRESPMSRLERPALPEHRRVQTPTVVTPRDLTDVQLKMDNLNFDINTLGVRCELQVAKEMDFYIPGYMDKLANRKPEPIPVPEPEKRPLHWTSKIVNNLAYPKAAPKASHNKSCDARHRGWQKVSKRPGTHVILTSQTHPNTEHGKLFSKMEQTAMDPVQYLHPEYVIRYTPKSALPAPSSTATTTTTPTSAKKQPQQQTSIPNFDFKSLKNSDDNNNDSDNNDDNNNEDNQIQGQQIPETTVNVKGGGKSKSKVGMEFFHSKYLTGESSVTHQSNDDKDKDKQPPSTTPTTKQQQSHPTGLSTKTATTSTTNESSAGDVERRKVFQPQSKSVQNVTMTSLSKGSGSRSASEAVAMAASAQQVEDVPMPYMEHSRPKIVGVGQIGTISLLESIKESRDLEERFVEEVMRRTGGRDKNESKDVFDDGMMDNGNDDDNDDNDDDNIDDAEQLSKSLKLNLQKDQLKSQPQSRKARPQGGNKDCFPFKRKTRSAPSGEFSSATRTGSPRKVSASPQKFNKRRVKSSDSSTRCKSASAGAGAGAGDKRRGLGRQMSGTSTGSMGDAGSTPLSSSYDYGTTLSSSDQQAFQQFVTARGSVTSEENEDPREVDKDTADTLTTRRMLTASCGLEEEEECGDDDKRRRYFIRSNDRDEADEVESFYSDALTLPSSSGLTELESPSVRHCSVNGFRQNIPDISLDLGESMDSVGGKKRMMARGGGGNRVQFNTTTLGEGGRPELRDNGTPEHSTAGFLSPMNLRPNVVSALSGNRRDSFKIMTDYRDYLSDSGLNNSNTNNNNNGSQKRIFSKETRDRLIGRVENSISPDLRMMLLTEGSNNKVSVPAS